MTLTAQGSVQDTDGTGFTASFYINGGIYQYVGTFAQGETVPAFSSINAKMDYSGITILHGDKSFTGYIGPDTFSLSISGSTSVSGSLSDPISVSLQVDGTGEWSKK
ncbi:hypothetical protein BOTBODRAFT_34351 [Botryobasidium botryosum FD-172 SS1]|uniref:Uncharacterized protein n=1 Tax=Botryobasidium botryosum (strain FD-172 SS1) TaxID=930990 RepID=A0A067MA43_BOTB1|nr:hypothetical protein BOTBODRAFT_34351 [Botryobasidium botryosum FD-172 SS1]